MRFGTPLGLGLALTLISVLLLGAGGGELPPEPADGIDVFFRDSDLSALAKQEIATYPDAEAGESKRLQRSFPDAPPQISHTVEDMLPITLDDNECLECHHPENAVSKEDLPVPKTHFKRPVMRAGKKGEPMVWVVAGYEEGKDVAGARYQCNMCHTPQANNARLLESRFERIEGKPTQ